MNQQVLCAGVVVADHACGPISRLPAAGELVAAERMLLTIGGNAANVAVALARLGVSAFLAGRVGDDPFGALVRQQLLEQGVDVSLLQVDPEAETSQTLIVNVAGQDRRFIHFFGANARFEAADIQRARLQKCGVLHVGGYLLLPGLIVDELAGLLAFARQAGVRTVLDVTLPGRGDLLEWIEPILPHVDVFLPNRDEAAAITGEQDPLLQAELFHHLGARAAVVTCGKEGAVVVSNSRRLRAGAYPVELVDGSGAGDAFNAGWILGLLHGLPEEDCLRFASAMGASSVRSVGATPGLFTRSECEEFMARHPLFIEQI